MSSLLDILLPNGYISTWTSCWLGLNAHDPLCCSVEEAWELQNTVKQLRDQLVMAMEQCASSEKALRQATRKRRSWTKPADDSVLTSLKARGIELDDLYKESKLNTA